MIYGRLGIGDSWNPIAFFKKCDSVLQQKTSTLPKTNIAPEKLPSQKERIVFQPSIFRCELLVFWEGIQIQIRSQIPMSIPSCRFDTAFSAMAFENPCHFDFLSPSIQRFDVAFLFWKETPDPWWKDIHVFKNYWFQAIICEDKLESEMVWLGVTKNNVIQAGNIVKKHLEFQPLHWMKLKYLPSLHVASGTVAAYWRQLYLEPLGGERGNWSFFLGGVKDFATPWKINMVHLQITYLERKMIFQASMIMFHVNLPGCMRWRALVSPPKKVDDGGHTHRNFSEN